MIFIYNLNIKVRYLKFRTSQLFEELCAKRSYIHKKYRALSLKNAFFTKLFHRNPKVVFETCRSSTDPLALFLLFVADVTFLPMSRLLVARCE